MNKTLKEILQYPEEFSDRVFYNTKNMELDSAFYFTFGEWQSELFDEEEYELTEEDLDAIIDVAPELEF